MKSDNKICGARVGKKHLLLLKVLTCLYTQHVSCKTEAAKLYLSNPNEASWALMSAQLTAISAVINTSVDTLSVVTPVDTTSFARIVAANADGNIQYDTALVTFDIVTRVVTDGNSYLDAIQGTLGSIAQKKQVQMLNTDECKTLAYQISPSLSHDPTNASADPAVFITEAMVVERAGCAGVANIGFIATSLEVDLTTFSFNTCPCTKC